MRALPSLPLLALATAVAAAACSTKPPPEDCGSDDMAIVTFRATNDDLGPQRVCVDIHAAARVDASATSAGVDESFAVSRPGVYPWTNLTFREASEACGRAGKFLCDWATIKLITPLGPSLAHGRVSWDNTTVDAVPRNGPETSVPHRYDPVNPYDMVIGGQTGKPPFPESRGSVAFYTTVPIEDVDDYDATVGWMTGAISGGRVAGGVAEQAPVPTTDFKHPLVGFRCCTDARMRDAFPPLPQSPTRVRPGPDTEVPLAP